MNNQDSVVYVVLGSILALATSFLVEFWKQYNKQKELRENFKIVFRLELKSLLTIIDKLTEGYGNTTFYSLMVIEQLDRSLARIDSSRKDTIYLKEDSKKEEILTCINDLLVIASDMRANENYAFAYKDAASETPEAKEIRMSGCERQRQMYSLRTVDLKRRVQDIINFLS